MYPAASYDPRSPVPMSHSGDLTTAAAEHLPLTAVVLHLLLALSDGDRHGYAVAQEVERLTDGAVRLGPGTLYGSLRRLLDAALIEEAAARADADERRRYYRVTALGRRALELELERLARVVAVARARRLLHDPEPA